MSQRIEIPLFVECRLVCNAFCLHFDKMHVSAVVQTIFKINVV